MKLLLTNDDGYDAPGITILAQKLSEVHSVYVLGPDRNRSAVSNHVTMYDKLTVGKVSDRLWKCSGYPADCAAIGFFSNLFDVKFDALVSGINWSANMGADILFSETLCKRDYQDKIKITKSNGIINTEYVFGGGKTLEETNSDYEIVQEGYISVSRVYAEPLCDKIVDDISFKL